MQWPALMVMPFVLDIKRKGRVPNPALLIKRHLTVSFVTYSLQSKEHRFVHHLIRSKKKSEKLSIWIMPPTEDSSLVDPSTVFVIGVVGDATSEKSPAVPRKRKLKRIKPLPNLRKKKLQLLMTGFHS